MKKITLCGLSFFILLSSVFGPINTSAAQSTGNSGTLPGTAKGQGGVLLLDPAIQQAIARYYQEYFKDSPVFAPGDITVLSTERAEENQSLVIDVKLQVMPYFGPHLYVGVDDITLQVQNRNVQVEKFEHVRSYSLPSNYQYEIKDKWPPK